MNQLPDKLTGAVRALNNKLYGELNTDKLEEEARELGSGLTGWLLKKYLYYPLIGKHISNIRQFGYKYNREDEKCIV